VKTNIKCGECEYFHGYFKNPEVVKRARQGACRITGTRGRLEDKCLVPYSREWCRVFGIEPRFKPYLFDVEDLDSHEI